MLSEEATNTIFIVFGLTWSGLEPTIYRTRDEQANHYTTDAAVWHKHVCKLVKINVPLFCTLHCYIRRCCRSCIHLKLERMYLCSTVKMYIQKLWSISTFTIFAVLEMKLRIYWFELNSWSYFYIVLEKLKIYWYEQNFTGLGPEDLCSSWRMSICQNKVTKLLKSFKPCEGTTILLMSVYTYWFVMLLNLMSVYTCWFVMLLNLMSVYTYWFVMLLNLICVVKPVYKGHSWEPENMLFMNRCPLYTG